jgi:rod shape-determining protein MreC
MKKINLKKSLLISASTVLLVIISFFTINATQIASDISNAGFGFFGSLQYAIFNYPIQKSGEFFEDLSLFLTQRDQERFTQQELDTLASYKAELEEAYRQIAQLKEVNEITLSSNEYNALAATVLYRSADAFLNEIIINVGAAEGVVLDSAIMTSKGLIGKVSRVNEHQSIVRLLTTQTTTNRVSVKIQVSPEATAEAILQRYNPEKGAFEVTLLDTNVTINPDNTVITSGIGGVFPAGLLVGSVSEIEQLPNSLAVLVYVKPAANFYSFDYALVISRPNSEVSE